VRSAQVDSHVRYLFRFDEPLDRGLRQHDAGDDLIDRYPVQPGLVGNLLLASGART
jgi:hypothetical protein